MNDTHVLLTDPHPLAPPPASPRPLADAIRQELRQLLEAPTFGVRQLTQIARLAEHGKGLMQAIDGHAAEDCRTTPSIGSSFGSGSGSAFGSAYASGGGGATLNVANPAETWGTKALRELTAVVQRLANPRRDRLAVMRELAVAREEGLEDVAAELKEELAAMAAGGDALGATAALEVAEEASP